MKTKTRLTSISLHPFTRICKTILTPLLVACLGLLGPTSCTSRDSSLPRGVLSPAAEAAFDQVFLDVNAVSTCDLHSLLVIRNDSLLYEKYSVGHSADELHILWSASKTFTATAVGFAVQDGLLALDTPVSRYMPADLLADVNESTRAKLDTLTLHHLLCMSSGLCSDSVTDRIRAGEVFSPLNDILRRGFIDTPGAHWRYNNCDTYLAGMIVTWATGQALDDYIVDRLFRPLQITSYSFERDATGQFPGAFGLHLSARDMAKFGLFILHQGQYNGEQLLRTDWFERATAVHIYQRNGRPAIADSEVNEDNDRPSDWRCGYCYQMWACSRPGCTRVDGMWGQYIVIMPDKNAIAVMTSLSTDREAQFATFWKNVYDNL